MNTQMHPDHSQLNAYAFQPEADELSHVGLHLAGCKQCRDEVMLSSRLQANFATIADEACSAEQQQLVDDYLYNDKNTPRSEHLKQVIRDNPLLLKSTLHSLSHSSTQTVSQAISQPQQASARQSFFSLCIQWFQALTSTWTLVGATAIITLALTVLVMQQSALNLAPADPVSIASYQDNKRVRFFPRDQLPGIGFFSGAMQSSETYRNIDIKIDANHSLVLNWHPVNNALEYEISLFHFLRGEKKLIDTFKTHQTSGLFKLEQNGYNQRYEWVLSGHTTDDKTFITSGGFVLQKRESESDL